MRRKIAFTINHCETTLIQSTKIKRFTNLEVDIKNYQRVYAIYITQRVAKE